MTSVSTDRRFGVNSGKAVKVPCKAATTANITLSGEQTIDGVSCVTDDRVLVRSQTTGSENGIWVVDTGSWSRALDFDDVLDVTEGTIVFVNQGTTYNNTAFVVTTTGTITPGTTSISFSSDIKFLILDVTTLKIGGVTVTSTASELNYTDVTTPGTAEASKAVVTNGSNAIGGIGKIGAGTSVRSTSSGIYTVDIGTDSSISTNTSNGNFRIDSNAKVNSSDALEYVMNGYDVEVALATNTGAFTVFTAPSGIAGNAITLTERFKVANDGTTTINGNTVWHGGNLAYVTGTFTPVVFGATTAGTGTYTVQNGSYTKIGDIVYFQCYVEWIAHTGTGNMRISGLPYTSTTTTIRPPINIITDGIALGGDIPVAYVADNTTHVYILATDLATNLTAAIAIDAAGTIQLSGTYKAQ